ncbi:MAG: hypothetical protein Q7R83_02610 [bacterium]|nr:hypothetical protein [bacterium]
MKWQSIGILACLIAIGAGCSQPTIVTENPTTRPTTTTPDVKQPVVNNPPKPVDPSEQAREAEALKMREAVRVGKILKTADVAKRFSDAQGSIRIVKMPDGSLVLTVSDNFLVRVSDPITVKLSRYSDPRNSAEVEARGSLSLGTLPYNSGGQLLLIPGGTDVSGFRSVVLYSPTQKVIYAMATFQQ